MRHLWTLIAALVIAPLSWFLLAIGQSTSLRVLDDENTATPSGADILRPLVFLLVAGLLLGLIATLRMSPLGAVLTGVVYAGSYILLMIAPHGVVKALSKDISFGGLHADLSMPLRTGTAALVGGMLLLALLSVSRWRRWPEPDLATESWSESSTTRRPSPSTLAGWTSFLRDDSRPMSRN
ncbi:hypothetical protein HDA40_000640 [Hamadaea flava]|uniref:Uncharacterized protein n=1 Tax=Hamadaea flava TaxID=1742688 RepID=A0ABV8M0D1_9ACTN|nr:hypothetical protein [Hamadaea flava]MCP2322133.1 hypothetical protein [Hamadaea flava]